MTERTELQKTIVAKVRDHADFLKHNVATWQLLARAADEIERIQAELDRAESEISTTMTMRLKAENERLRTALEEIAEGMWAPGMAGATIISEIRQTAATALANHQYQQSQNNSREG